MPVTEFVPSDRYYLTITSTADNGKTYSSNYDLTVLNSKISLSGTVTTNKGRIPTKIIFEQMGSSGGLTGKAYSSVIYVSGNYAVVLPNKEFFAVSVEYKSPDGTSGIKGFIQPYGTSAEVGVNSITCPFAWYS